MARKVGSQEYGPLTRNWSFELTQLKAFEALVRADERERILDMCKEGLWDAEGIRLHLNKQEQA
jgi:hypothetical protein